MADEPTTNDKVEEAAADPPQTTEAPEEQVESPEEPQAEEAEEPAEEPAQEEGEEQAPEEKPVSRRETRRVADLLGKYPQLGNRQPEPSQPNRNDRLDYGQALDADPEVIKQLEADRQREAQSQYNAGLEQAKSIQFHTRLEIDAPKIEAKYPQLDPNSPEFDDQAADDINSLYLYLTGFDSRTGYAANPDLRYSDFVDAQMGLTSRLASKKTAQTAKNVAKQAATTGLRPDGSQAKRLNLNRAPEDMTMEELYASIGQKPPKK